jgi:hypothetical protein
MPGSRDHDRHDEPRHREDGAAAHGFSTERCGVNAPFVVGVLV